MAQNVVIDIDARTKNFENALDSFTAKVRSTVDTQTLMNCLENVYNRKKRVENKVYFGEDFKHSACGKGNFTRRMKYDGQYQSQKKLL